MSVSVTYVSDYMCNPVATLTSVTSFVNLCVHLADTDNAITNFHNGTFSSFFVNFWKYLGLVKHIKKIFKI